MRLTSLQLQLPTQSAWFIPSFSSIYRPSARQRKEACGRDVGASHLRPASGKAHSSASSYEPLPFGQIHTIEDQVKAPHSWPKEIASQSDNV